MYNLRPTSRYNKHLKRIAHDRKLIAEIYNVVELLSENDTPLPAKYKDHQLYGKYADYRECHVRPDWLLVYQKNKNELVLLLIGTGTHSLIFG